jgi:hypothetical protein
MQALGTVFSPLLSLQLGSSGLWDSIVFIRLSRMGQSNGDEGSIVIDREDDQVQLRRVLDIPTNRTGAKRTYEF